MLEFNYRGNYSEAKFVSPVLRNFLFFIFLFPAENDLTGNYIGEKTEAIYLNLRTSVGRQD